jgi:hypothetical protein
LFIDITLQTLFGSKAEAQKVRQRVDGKEKWVPLGEAMIISFENMIQRNRQPHLMLIGELKPYYLTSFDKDLDFNIT